VYFDDFKITHTKSNLIQGNEYYPFGMQTANSWTREAVTGNNYLANGGTELNATTQLYDLHYRNYDAALGRMFQLDPMASKYGSLTPYNYSLNNPTNLNDPLGDDVEPQPMYPREYQCAQCWREGENGSLYMRVSGGGSNSLGFGWRPGMSGISMGSGNHWADGMQYSDWSSYGGSQMFRDGLAMGLTSHGGRLYDYSDGSGKEIKEGTDGRLGRWERRSRYNLEGYDGSPGVMPETEIWDVFIPVEKKSDKPKARNYVIEAIHRGQNAFADDPWGGLFLNFVTGGPAMFELAGLAKGAFMGIGNLAASSSSKILLNSARQLQSKFKHAADFGVVGNFSKANAARFSSALNKHINAPGTQVIQGVYRSASNPVTFYLNPQTGLNVIASSSGHFITGAALGPAQVQSILMRGFLW
jgi:RHS repeat-associated protein